MCGYSLWLHATISGSGCAYKRIWSSLPASKHAHSLVCNKDIRTESFCKGKIKRILKTFILHCSVGWIMFSTLALTSDLWCIPSHTHAYWCSIDVKLSLPGMLPSPISDCSPHHGHHDHNTPSHICFLYTQRHVYARKWPLKFPGPVTWIQYVVLILVSTWLSIKSSCIERMYLCLEPCPHLLVKDPCTPWFLHLTRQALLTWGTTLNMQIKLAGRDLSLKKLFLAIQIHIKWRSRQKSGSNKTLLKAWFSGKS